MNWYRIEYVNEYGIERAHTFSGGEGVLQLIVDHYRIDPAHVSSFTVNGRMDDLSAFLLEEDGYTHDGVTYRIGESVPYDVLHWYSDWNGDEVGYDNLFVVGLYSFKGSDVHLYLNAEDGAILEMWREEG